MRWCSPLVGLFVGALGSAGCEAPTPSPPGPLPARSEVRAAAEPGPTAVPAASAALPSAIEPEPEPEAPFTSEETFSLRIQGGEVIDGRGAPRRRADVLVRGDRIAYVGLVDDAVKADHVLDATGAVVTPGFVDAHAHGDPRHAAFHLAQGVTTLVIGQDGQSPGRGGSLRATLGAIEAGRPAMHVAALVGHASVRIEANVGKTPTSKQLERMVALVERDLDAGAVGLSTALEYTPGRFAGPDELAAIAAPVGRRGGVVMSHLRSEDDDAIEDAIEELLTQARASGARAHVAHLKVVYGKGAARAEAILETLAAARRSGVEVTADLYPYTASYTGLDILFPPDAKTIGDHEAQRARGGSALRAYLKARVDKRGGPEATLFGSGPYAGKTLKAAADARGVPFEEILLELGPAGATAAYFVMDEALQERLFQDPFVMVGSDGGGGAPHPRSHASFARTLETLVQQKKLVSLEEAVRKLTLLPMQTLRLGEHHGSLEEGKQADLAVFVPSEIRAHASFATPHRTSTGMRHVVVAGTPVLVDGKARSARPGRVLRAPWATRPKGAGQPAKR